MSPKELVQDSAQYNKRLNLARKSLKVSKRSEPILPSHLTNSQTSEFLPRASDLVAREHKAPSAASTKPQTSRRPRKSNLVFDHVQPTSTAKLNHNYRMVLSKLQHVGLTVAKDSSPRVVQRLSIRSESPDLADSPVQRPGYVPALGSLLCCLARHADLFPGLDILGLYCQVVRHLRR